MSIESLYNNIPDQNEDMLITSSDYYKKPYVESQPDNCEYSNVGFKYSNCEISVNSINQSQNFEDMYFNNFYKYANFEDDVNENYKEHYKECKSSHRNVDYENYINENQDSCPSEDSNDGYSCDGKSDQAEQSSDDDSMVIYGYDDFDNVDNIDNIDNDIQNCDQDYQINMQIFNKEKMTNINVILEENIRTKNDKIIFEGGNITEIPEIFNDFVWVSELIIKNSNIKKLENLPYNLKSITAENNSIPEIDGMLIPEGVKILKLIRNKTLIVKFLKKGIIYLDLSYNDFEKIDCEIPTSVETLKLICCELLEKIPCFEKNNETIEHIDIFNTNIKNIDSVPDSVKHLDTSKCPIVCVSKLPKSLVTWKSFKSKIREIKCEFPDFLTDVDLSDSHLSSCPKFNSQIKTIDISSNLLTEIPDFPTTVESVDIRDNTFLSYDDILILEKSLPTNVAFFSGSIEDDDSDLQQIGQIDEFNQTDQIYQLNQLNQLNQLDQSDQNEENKNFLINFWRQKQQYQNQFSNMNNFFRSNHNSSDEFSYSETNPHYIILPNKAIALK